MALGERSGIGLTTALGIALGVALGSAGCGGRMPAELASGGGRFAACPKSPNCVSSEASDALHAIDPLRIRGDAGQAWEALGRHLRSLPRVEIVRNDPDYLYAVFTTRLMRYRDDVEIGLDRANGVMRVRSASRIGYGDMGVNRARIDAIRAALAEQGVVELRAAPPAR